jgi:hypothetical protein
MQQQLKSNIASLAMNNADEIIAATVLELIK